MAIMRRGRILVSASALAVGGLVLAGCTGGPGASSVCCDGITAGLHGADAPGPSPIMIMSRNPSAATVR